MLRSTLLAVCVALGTLAPEPVRSETPASTLVRIRETGIIRIGYNEFAAPFSYKDETGAPIGYAIDLCRRVVDLLRQKEGLPEISIKYVVRTPGDRVTFLNEGTDDIDCAANSNTAERRQKAAFTFPTFFTPTQFVALKSSKLNRISDLAGHSVASMSGSINIGILNTENRLGRLNIAVVPAPTIETGFKMVADGHVSAFAMDGILLANVIAQSEKPDDYELSGESFGAPLPYGFMTRHDDAKFHDAVNAALRDLYVSGEATIIYGKWFTMPIPPRGINLNVPLSDTMKVLFAHPRDAAD